MLRRIFTNWFNYQIDLIRSQSSESFSWCNTILSNFNFSHIVRAWKWLFFSFFYESGQWHHFLLDARARSIIPSPDDSRLAITSLCINKLPWLTPKIKHFLALFNSVFIRCCSSYLQQTPSPSHSTPYPHLSVQFAHFHNSPWSIALLPWTKVVFVSERFDKLEISRVFRLSYIRIYFTSLFLGKLDSTSEWYYYHWLDLEYKELFSGQILEEYTWRRI